METPNINVQFNPMNNTVFVGNDAKMKIDTHVVQPSILYNLDMTHKDFTEYHNCIIDNKELIKKIENGEKDDKTKLIKNELTNINNYFEKEIDDKFNIYLFNEWKTNDRYSEIRFLQKYSQNFFNYV